MHKCLSTLLICAALSGIVSAESAVPPIPDAAKETPVRAGRLVESGKKAVTRLVQNPGASAPVTTESWPKRHPVVVGTLVGAGAGAVAMSAAFCGGNSGDICVPIAAPMGAGLGAGIGALAGWLTSR